MADGEPLLDGEARYLPAFTRFDRNGDGNISEDELFDAMRDLGHQISEYYSLAQYVHQVSVTHPRDSTQRSRYPGW